MAAGTSVGLVAVETIHCRSTRETYKYGTPGQYRKRLFDTMLAIQRGEEEDPLQWCQKLVGNDTRGTATEGDAHCSLNDQR